MNDEWMFYVGQPMIKAAKTTNDKNETPVGTILYHTLETVPPLGWELCDGRTVNKLLYPELYKVIGDNYTDRKLHPNQFCVPDLRHRRTTVKPTRSKARYIKLG